MNSEGHSSGVVCHLLRMHINGYCNRSVCLLVSLCTSHFSLVGSYITQYFTQLDFEWHGIDAIRNGFLRVRFAVEKKREKNWGLLYTHARSAIS